MDGALASETHDLHAELRGVENERPTPSTAAGVLTVENRMTLPDGEADSLMT